MKTDNELIAEFMGIRFEKDPCVKSEKKYWHYDELRLMSDTLRFDTSFDWLMPAVHRVGEYTLATDKAREVTQCRVTINREILYFKVVQFIKWHNSQQK